MIRLIATLALLGLAASPSRADDADAVDCKNPKTQFDLNVCADRDMKTADAALNSAYRAAVARLAGDRDRLAALAKAQKAWIAFRDDECAFKAPSTALGSITPMLHLMCDSDLTRRRTADFNAMLHCQEGDPACPLPPE